MDMLSSRTNTQYKISVFTVGSVTDYAELITQEQLTVEYRAGALLKPLVRYT